MQEEPKNKSMLGLERINQRLNRIQILQDITNGLLNVLPLIIVGAIFGLITNLPIQGYQNFLVQAQLKDTLALASQFTTNIVAVIACLSLTYVRVQRAHLDGLIPLLISFVAFLIITPLTVIKTVSYLSFDWLGAAGFFMAIIIGLSVGNAFVFMINHHWVIKLPDAVPPMVSKSLSSVVPAVVITGCALLIRFAFSFTPFKTIHNVIYTLIQQPLTHMGSSIWAMLALTLIAQLFWFIGIHGMLVVMPILLTVYLPMDLANLAAYNTGKPLPYVTTIAFWIICCSIGGGGATLGLNFMMAFRAKSDQFKVMGRLALPAGIFGINEPLVYGIPLVFNAIFFLPYVFLPIINLGLGFLFVKIGIIPAASGATILGMPIPIIFSGLMEGSWKLGVFQLFLALLDTVAYYPFFKVADTNALRAEQKASNE